MTPFEDSINGPILPLIEMPDTIGELVDKVNACRGWKAEFEDVEEN